MIYIDRGGGFDYDLFYSEMVDKFDNAKFIEIGSFKGGSTVFMASKIKEKNKNIKFYSVDFFQPYIMKGQPNQGSYSEYIVNISPVKEFIITIVGESSEVSKQFEKETFDFIFIDGNHDYDWVVKDISAWFPKIKTLGVFQVMIIILIILG